ncbi:hypothetical protein GCM10009782_15130 [Glycomyces algeriensis]
MNPGEYPHPSPIHEAWLFVPEVRPSWVAEEYDNDRLGAGPVAGGTRIPYE